MNVFCCCFVCCSERVLGVVNSEGLHDPGPVRWPLALCLLAAWILIFLCMLKGIRSSGKVSGHTRAIVCTLTTSRALARPAELPSLLLKRVCMTAVFFRWCMSRPPFHTLCSSSSSSEERLLRAPFRVLPSTSLQTGLAYPTHRC